MANAMAEVMADHLLSPPTLVSAQPPLLAHLQPEQLQPWLQEHRGKKCIVKVATWIQKKEHPKNRGGRLGCPV